MGADVWRDHSRHVLSDEPGPIWTPLIPSTMPFESVAKFGENTPMKRAGPPAELATAYMMLADPLSSYVSRATIAVTGGRPFL